MGIEKEAYAWLLTKEGLKEIPGPKDQPLIVLSHKLCNIVEQDTKATHIDEIANCSSMMVLSHVCANIKRNPKRARQMLERKGFTEKTILECFAAADVNYTAMWDIDTGKVIVPPTWKAAAISWKDWAVTVPFDKAQRGDIAVLTRDGGAHVAFVDEDKLGRLFLTLFGANQGDKVCTANWYARSRLISIRRSHD